MKLKVLESQKLLFLLSINQLQLLYIYYIDVTNDKTIIVSIIASIKASFQYFNLTVT